MTIVSVISPVNRRQELSSYRVNHLCLMLDKAFRYHTNSYNLFIIKDNHQYWLEQYYK